MARTKVRSTLLRQRLAQQRGINLDTGPTLHRRNRWVPPKTPNHLKTSGMLLLEMAHNLDIGDILRSGPLHHNPAHPRCNRCLSCVYGIRPSTASKWRKRLGIEPYKES